MAIANKEAAAEADNAAKAAANASKSFSDYGYRLTQTAGFYKLNNEQLNLMNQQFSGIKLGMEATFRAAQMKEYTQQIYNANTAMQRLTNASAQGAVTQDILNDAASAASRAADKLGNTELTKFRNAISDAQRRLNALRQEAHDATRALEAELAELNGNTEAIYSLQQERKIRELQQNSTMPTASNKPTLRANISVKSICSNRFTTGSAASAPNLPRKSKSATKVRMVTVMLPSGCNKSAIRRLISTRKSLTKFWRSATRQLPRKLLTVL